MRATINGVEYHVRFQHVLLPFHDVTTGPTIHEAIEVLSGAAMELEGIDVQALRGVDVKAAIRDIVGRYVGSNGTLSHRTACFILDISTCVHGAEEGQFCGMCEKQIAYRDFSARIVSSGMAFCDKRDNFDRRTGRWLSFHKAISAFPAASQREFLDWYMQSGMRTPKAWATLASKAAA